ncbi:hypothetical protein AAMO2058_000939400 [Amorphochlora amoebiformis]
MRYALYLDDESLLIVYPQVKGYDFNKGVDFDKLFASFLNHGFQATSLAMAAGQINEMLEQKRFSNITIFLGYTSNMVSCGNREVIRYLVEHKLIDAIVTTAGGIEEDIMKTLQPHFMGSFDLSGKALRRKGHNRIGNLLVPNENYCLFEKWMNPMLDELLDQYTPHLTTITVPGTELRLERASNGNLEISWENSTDDALPIDPPYRVVGVNNILTPIALKSLDTRLELFGERGIEALEIESKAVKGWKGVAGRVNITILANPPNLTPSEMIRRMGLRCNDSSSILYHASRNHIPIFCPALTDGSVGDMIFFHSYKRPGLTLDIARDLRRLNEMAMSANNTGMIILGGGVVKHHICNANLMRNGADYAVFVNTAHDFDGSDAGAKPDEAISWGKIKIDAQPVKVCGDASFLFPLLVAQTFAKYVESLKSKS